MDIVAGKRRIRFLFFLYKKLFYVPRPSLSNSVCDAKKQLSYWILPLHQSIKG